MINSYKKVVFEKYATFEGRATRSEYWWFTLANWIVGMVISFVGSLFDPTYGGLALQGIYSLAVLIPSLAVGVRRLHDTNHSGWWLFISLIPISISTILKSFHKSDALYASSHPLGTYSLQSCLSTP